MPEHVPQPVPTAPPGERFRSPALVRARAYVEEILDTTGTGWRMLVAGCLLVGVAVGALWWLTRQAPVPVESTLPLFDPDTVTTATAPPGPVVVHVAGAVVHPGVQQLPASARVVDAVDAAGGLTPEADAGRVNLAAELVDGSQIYVPALGEEPAAVVGAETGSGEGPVDVNVADGATLETLPGIGPSTAAAIIDHRERNGPFTSVDGLLAVRGIGEAKLAELRDLVRV